MNSLLIVTDCNLPADAALQSAERLIAAWPAVHRPKITTLSLKEFVSKSTREVSAAVIWMQLSGATTRALDEALNKAYQLHATVLLSTSNDPENYIDDCFMALGPATTERETELCLRTLLTQTSAMQALKTEERLLRQQQASTARQINQIDEELRLAAQLQRQFVPHSLPTLGGFDFEVMWRPAGYVSGDVYDVQRLDENHLGVFMADAVGHGVPAALMTMYIKRSLRTKVVDHSAPRGYRLVEPKDAIAELNNDLFTQNMPGQTRFATSCYALINTQTGVTRFARAGHPYPMLLKANGETEFIKADGGLLGLFETDDFEQIEFTMSQGDRLLVYSDGFEVAFPDPNSENIANEDYLNHFQLLREGTPENGLEKLTMLMEQQAGSLNQRDDLTLICCNFAQEAKAQPSPQKQAA